MKHSPKTTPPPLSENKSCLENEKKRTEYGEGIGPKVNLKSSVESKGKRVTQIITNINGIKKTFRGVKTNTIEEGSMVHFETTDGRLVLINTQNISWVEIFKEDD